MVRYSVALLVGLVAAGHGAAATWAEALFEETEKNFGSVGYGMELKHPSPLVNHTGVPVHVAGVNVSCGCVQATVLQADLAPGQSTAVEAVMHTERFHGDKTVTIFVQFDQPRFEEVRLYVRANSRDDLSVTPNTLELGRVRRGGSPTATTTVTLRGNDQWQVVDAISESTFVQTELKELRRDDEQVVYQLTARVRPSLPAGYWYNDIWLTTNNPAMPAVRVPLTVEVEPALALTPGELSLGDVKIGTKTERKVVLRGEHPFRITAVQGADEQWSVKDTTAESRELHVLTVTLLTKKSGQRAHAFRIQTDLKGEGPVTLVAHAQVVP